MISFAIAPIQAGEVLSPEFKEANHPVYLFQPEAITEDRRAVWEEFHRLHQEGRIAAAWAVENGMAEAVMKMSFGSRIGFKGMGKNSPVWYTSRPGAIIAELTEDMGNCHPEGLWGKIGHTTAEPVVAIGADTAPIDELLALNEGVLESVYPTRTGAAEAVAPVTYEQGSPVVCAHKIARPKAVIPVFPGTNCEYDSARACMAAGMDAEIVVVRNLTESVLLESAQALERAIRSAQVVFLPGGFSGGDEPDGSAKFIVSFLRSPRLTDAVTDLLEHRDGLMLGICNGFQALVKLGLLPFGRIATTDSTCPTLTCNAIGRHQSSIVRTRICTNNSPWLMETAAGEIYSVPVSHGEGRFVASEALLRKLAAAGQIATQYVDPTGAPTMDTAFNPNGSVWAIEGIISPDGRVLGKMGHSERIGPNLYRNVPGRYDMGLFRSAVKYFG